MATHEAIDSSVSMAGPYCTMAIYHSCSCQRTQVLLSILLHAHINQPLILPQLQQPSQPRRSSSRMASSSICSLPGSVDKLGRRWSRCSYLLDFVVLVAAILLRVVLQQPRSCIVCTSRPCHSGLECGGCLVLPAPIK
jgi:hypothetical protein